jgi:hypothetical protein
VHGPPESSAPTLLPILLGIVGVVLGILGLWLTIRAQRTTIRDGQRDSLRELHDAVMHVRRAAGRLLEYHRPELREDLAEDYGDAVAVCEVAADDRLAPPSASPILAKLPSRDRLLAAGDNEVQRAVAVCQQAESLLGQIEKADWWRDRRALRRTGRVHGKDRLGLRVSLLLLRLKTRLRRAS